MLKVVTIVGTRPELIKMSRVIALFDKHTNHILVHTGQNFDYELNEIFFEELGIRRPNYFLEAAGSTAMETIAQVLQRSDQLLAELSPDAVMLYGDTNSCLAVIAAKRQHIPVFHMEAGNRCFDRRVPEELNRKIVDHLNDINLTLTEHARRYLIAEGLPADRVIKVGGHMEEVFDTFRADIDRSNILATLNLASRRYFLVSAHRQENVDTPEKLCALLDSLEALVETYELDVVVSTHPRTSKRLSELPEFRSNPRIRFLKPFGFFDYNKLQLEAACVLSDSGTITEEASLLSFPAVTIRNAHERPEGMDEGVLIMAGLTRKRVLDAVRVAIATYDDSSLQRVPSDYIAGAVSTKILKIVHSYTDYVKSVVWRVPD